MNLKININQLFIATFILFFVIGIDACQENQEMTPEEILFEGVYNKKIELVEQALKNDININIQEDQAGCTALLFAAANGFQEITKLLLTAKADPDIQNDEGDTALILAAKYNDIEMVKLLLDAKANPDIQGKYGNTALIIASSQNERAGALIYAAKYNDIEMVKLLLDAKANPDIQDEYGNTALIIASSKHDQTIVKLLLDANANPNIKNKNDDTALIKIAECGLWYQAEEIVKLLLDANIDINIKNKKNKTSLDIAKEFGFCFRSIVKMLKNEPKRRQELKEFVQKETSEYLPTTLANIVSEYVVSC